MKCPCCGGEIPTKESIFPFCGENISNSKPKSQSGSKKKRLLALAAVLLCAAGAAAWLVWGKQGSGITPEEAAKQTNVLAYSTKKEICTLLPENHQSLVLFRNSAKDLDTYEMFSQVIDANSAYVGAENFARIGDEVLFIQTSFNAYNSTAQQVEADYVLYFVKDGQEPVEIDRDVQGITCSSDKAVYYQKIVDGSLQQYRYEGGIITPVSELLPGDLTVITHCSDDNSVLGFVTALISEDGGYVMHNGYLKDGVPHFFEQTDSEVYFLSPNGKHMYLIDLADDLGRTVNVSYVKDLSTGELTQVATAVSEVSFYEDSGSMTCIANVELSDDVMNPVGTLLHFDPETQTTKTISKNAVALLESAEKSYAWLNENSKEMTITEQSSLSSFPSAVQNGQFHYIDANGTFCAADENGTVAEIFPDFYSPEAYSYNSEISYLAQMGQSFYWAMGDQVYRYTAGSLTAPEQVSLDESLQTKIEDGTSIGYVLCADGAVLEQSGNTLNLKPFGGPSSTVYDSPSGIYIIGLSEDGGKIYFVLDGQLLEKEINSEKEPVLLCDVVYDAVAVDNGLYVLKDYSEDGGTLLHIDYNSGVSTVLESNVITISDTMLQG
ncbi:MAG: hypothetical protein IJ411_00410 [Oscillospiraceae bacterium]|nr:hypothetical protein [Oscillospiraceae bacterium]